MNAESWGPRDETSDCDESKVTMPLAVTAIVLAILDKFLWLGVVFVA